jgi:hypothetical protein
MSLVSILRYNGAIVKVFKKKCNYNAWMWRHGIIYIWTIINISLVYIPPHYCMIIALVFVKHLYMSI